MNKQEIFQFINKLNTLDIPSMLFRETVFDIITFGKSSRIHIATTASIERTKKVLTEYAIEIVKDVPETISFKLENDVVFIRSIFNIPYDRFVKEIVPSDLTFNSLLMKSNGQIYDMYNGLPDLKNKILNFVPSFNEPCKTRLVLNCIRYVYKNNFSYTEQVKEYIKECLPHLSKNEKTNALFYFAENLLTNGTTDDDILLDNSFFANEQYPNTNISNYNEIISTIGAEKFVYLLLLLLNININKTRFNTIINAEEFATVKEAFTLDLNDEMTYYSFKEKHGQEHLSDIIMLQKKFAEITNTEYTEPVFHKETIFDFLALNTEFSYFESDLFSVTDEAKIVSETSAESFEIQTQKDVALEIEPLSEDVSQTPSSGDAFTFDITCETALESSEAEESPIKAAELSTKPMPAEVSTDDVTKSSSVFEEVSIDFSESDDSTDDVLTATNDTSHDVLSLLEEDDEREQVTTFKRNMSPRFTSNNIIEEPTNDTVANPAIVEPDVAQTVAEETFPATPVIFADSFSVPQVVEPTTNATENAMENATETAPSTQYVPTQPQVDKPQSIEDKKSSLIDNIFEEEVVMPDISLSSDFNDLAVQVAAQNREEENAYKRRTVDSNMMLDTVSEEEAMGLPQSEAPEEYDTVADFEISEQDLADILAELSGKKKNTFLDDDGAPEEAKEEIVGGLLDFSSTPNTFAYPPQPDTTQTDNDFFKSLNDDFTEIVGGNGK